jgi:hypothetical protein
MLDVADFGPNAHAPEFGELGVCYVRDGKAMKGSPPKRRSVLTVWEWVAEVTEEWVTEIRPLAASGSPALWPTERASRISLGAIDHRFAAAFPADAPATIRAFGMAQGQVTVEELVDRYRLQCKPVRDLLVDYLKERQPALDYASLDSVSRTLAGLFWARVEALSPGISTLRLPPEVARAWKEDVQTIKRSVTGPDGNTTVVTRTRINTKVELIRVRALYLDIAQWAMEEPERWAQWAVPSPVSDAEINWAKERRRRKARMDQRTRERLPVLPVLARTAADRRNATARHLQADIATPPGEIIEGTGGTLRRAVTPVANGRHVWAEDTAAGKRRNLSYEEEEAFWAFATIEVLRLTGIRCEELLELTHHGITEYRLPATGELVPLLQIAPMLRFLLGQEITRYQETVPLGLAPDLELAGFLVCEHRQLDDVRLHWRAKNISFDTALGYRTSYLLTAGVDATAEAVRASSHPDRERILHEILDARNPDGTPHYTDALVEEWLDAQRARFPASPAAENLKTWANHAARFGERDVSRRFLLAWADSQPRTEATLNTLQFHLAQLGFLTEAIEAQKEAVANTGAGRLKASKLLTLIKLQRQSGDFTGAWESLRDCAGDMPPGPFWKKAGLWHYFVKEHFLLVRWHPTATPPR